MNKLFHPHFLAAVALTISLSSAGQTSVGGDPGVLTGTLENGLSYYIRHNEIPAHSADFFFAQKVGSVNEEDNERGLAHFLEHMCFNGTEHFPGNSLISWLESVGVRFGANLNAYTSTDETVYNICKVPTARTTTLDSCLMILSDWSHRLLLNEADIDSERGVIVNEWRQRSSATNRMLERALPKIYPGSRYGERMPIGKMSVVENFSADELRDYYHRWYYPANQAVVVVGDIDPAYILERLKYRFKDIDTPKDVQKHVTYDVPDNDSIIVVTEKDPEQSTNMVQIHFKHEPYESECALKDDGLKDEISASLAGSMLAGRFDEMERSIDCPHTYLGIGDTKFLMSRPKRSFVMRGVVKAGCATDAVMAWMTEMRRALLYGFSKTELEAAVKEYAVSLDIRDKKALKTSNTEYARRYVRNFIDDDPVIAEAVKIEAERAMLETITTTDVVAWLRSHVSLDGRNAVILTYRPDNEKTPDIEAIDLKKAFFAAANSNPEPYVAPEVKTKLLSEEPEAGSIVSVDSLKCFDAKVYTLSNGIRVMSRYSAAVPDQIYIRGVGPGGLSQEYTPELASTMKLLDEGMNVTAFGDYTAAELKRFLSGKNIKAAVSVSNTEESVEAVTDRANMRDAFRLLYLKTTDPRRDDDAYRIYADRRRNGLKHVFSNPVQVMGDSIHRNVYSRHPLGVKETVETVDGADYGKMIEIYKQRFSDMYDFTFYITGDYDVDSLEVCIADYIASLPAYGRVEQPKDIGYRFTDGNNSIVFEREMETPRSVVYTFFNTPVEYNLSEVIKATTLGRILQMRLLADLRETRGWTYSIKGHCSITAGMNGDDQSTMLMPVYISVEPGHEEETAQIVSKTLADIAANGPTADELARVKEYLTKSHAEAVDDNAYWLLVMKNFVKFGQDMHTGYADFIANMSPDDIAMFARMAQNGNCIRVTMKALPKD